MAAEVKGITIELNGDTTGLQKAINQVRRETREFDKELSTIDRSLKFNPKNVNLLRQKIAVLNDATDKGEKNIEAMKNALKKMETDGVSRTSAEYRELEREIIKVESKQKEYNAELKKVKAAASSLGQASAKMAEFGNKATAAGQALAGVSAAAGAIDVALAGLAYKSGQAADDLATLSKVTGISTDELQKYQAAADLVDVSVDTIAKSQKKMKASMLSAAQGSKTTSEAFNTLGVSVTNANGELRGQDEVFADTIAALGQMENETERDAIAMQIFGKSAAELNPLIEDNGETYKRVADIFANNNLEIVDEETLQKANEFNDQIDIIKATWGAALNSIGMQLAGYLAPAMEKIAGVLEKVAGWLSQLSPETLTIIGIVAGVVAGLAPLLIIIGKLAFAISSIMGLASTLGISLTALAGPIGIAIAAIGALIAAGVWLYNNWDTVKEYAGIVADWITQKWTALKDAVIGAVTELVEKVRFYWEALKLGVEIIITAISSTITGIWDAIKTKTVDTFNSIKETAVSVWEGIKSAITNPIQTAVDFVAGAIEKIKGFFNGLKIELPHIDLPHFKLNGEFSLVPPKVPSIGVDWYDQGGIFNRPSVIGVGEKRPEFVGALDDLREIVRQEAGGNITVNVNAAPGMNIRELADVVVQKIITEQNRRRKAWA